MEEKMGFLAKSKKKNLSEQEIKKIISDIEEARQG